MEMRSRRRHEKKKRERKKVLNKEREKQKRNELKKEMENAPIRGRGGVGATEGVRGGDGEGLT